MNEFKMVAFEISNRCNYSHLHQKCPTNPNAEPIFLNEDVIYKVVEWLPKTFTGRIYFSIYNEPLVDPRLFTIISVVKLLCPGSIIELFTNGWNLNQYMLDKLVFIGVKEFKVSTYDPKEQERLSELEAPSRVKYEVATVCLDDRLGIYFEPETQSGVCLGPMVYLFINYKGEVSLCCFDYRYTCTFGSLYEQSIEEILSSERRKWVCHNLRAGIRTVSVCRKCNSQSFFNEGGS